MGTYLGPGQIVTQVSPLNLLNYPSIDIIILLIDQFIYESLLVINTHKERHTSPIFFTLITEGMKHWSQKDTQCNMTKRRAPKMTYLRLQLYEETNHIIDKLQFI